MRVKHLFAGLLAAGLSTAAHAQSPGVGGAPNPQPTSGYPGTFTSYSQIVPTTATTIWAAASGTARVRVVAIDTAVQGGTAFAATVWCAWGTAAGNPAAVGGVGSFALFPGFDDSGFGVNQSAMNCIQPAGSHVVRLETY